jgi:hypothetical protein
VQPEDGEEELWKDQEEDSSDAYEDSEDDSRDSDSENEANRPAPKRQRLALTQVREQQKGKRLSMAESSFRSGENSSQHSTVIASTPAPMQTEINEDGRTYSFLADTGLCLMEWLGMKMKKFQMMKFKEKQDLNLFLHQDQLQI